MKRNPVSSEIFSILMNPNTWSRSRISIAAVCSVYPFSPLARLTFEYICARSSTPSVRSPSSAAFASLAVTPSLVTACVLTMSAHLDIRFSPAETWLNCMWSMSSNLRSSNRRVLWRSNRSRKPAPVVSLQSETMSAWVFSMAICGPTCSAIFSRVVSDVTLAATARLVCFASIS